MATKISEPPRSIGRLLNFATGRTNALCTQILDPHGLSLPQWVILSCLWRDGALTVSALAELVGTGLPATSRIIERMEERGLVARTRHKSDGRATVVTVTDKGRALDHLADFYERINATLLAGFSDDERESVFDLLGRIQNNAEDAIT